MSKRADITQEYEWFRFEAKTINITITDASDTAVDIRNTALQWKVMREAGSTTEYLEKTELAGITVTGADNNVATIAIAADDYDDLEAGIHYHELWDRDNDQLLAHGSVYLQEASAE